LTELQSSLPLDIPSRVAAPPAAVSRRRRADVTLRRFLAVADCVAIVVALGVAVAAGGLNEGATGLFLLGVLTLPGWIVLLKLYGLYDRDGKRVSHSTVDDVPWTFHAMVVGTVGLMLASKALPGEALTLAKGLLFFGVGWLALLLGRAGARALASSRTAPDRVLFLGGTSLTQLLVEKMQRHREYRLEPVGYLDGADIASEPDAASLPHLGSIAELERVCREFDVDRVLVVAPAVAEDEVADVIRRSTRLNVRVSVIPDIVDVLGPSVEIDQVEGVTVLGINPPALARSSRFLKRTMDLVVASTALLVALPVMAVVAILVKVTSPGPILYSQERIGKGGKRFRIRKFRTMVQDAEQKADALRQFSAHSAWLLLENDPRITAVGRFLRTTSLDELPQLWNVVTGDMSLVGPRPMTPAIDEQILGWGRRRLDLTPGITGLWQVLGRTKIPFEEMLKLDYLYVTNWSLWQDMRLLVQTLPAVLMRRGVN
jgi:exopolysaccharide biosynthesis polyprenyl glycosylphosphotransferase